jgi:phage tail-like protein
LKRGLITNKVFTDWIEDAKDGFFSALPSPNFKPVDILISLMNESGDTVATWNVVNAYPVKWSISDLNARENAVVIESIEMAYQYFERQM